MENKGFVFTAENSQWNIELLEEAALEGKIKLIDGTKEVVGKEEIREFFKKWREGIVVSYSFEMERQGNGE